LMHEYYSKDLSRKISSAKQEKARRGELVTKNCAFGYILDESRNMVIDPEAAKTVQTIFEMYSNQKSIAAIEKRLYEENRPTPAAWKKHRWKTASTADFKCVWQKSVILSILRDEQYIGTYIAGKSRTVEIADSNRAKTDEADWIRIPDHHPAIVLQELFDSAQRQLHKKGEPLRKRKVGTAQRYAGITSPLKGKVICGHCGHTMRLSSTKNAAFHCWFTRSAPDTTCHGLRVLSSELEDAVRNIINNQSKLVLEAVDSQSIDQRSVREIDCENNMAELRNEKQQLYERFVIGDISREEYAAHKSALDAELERLGHIYTAISDYNKKAAPDKTSIEAAKAALRTNMLTQELVGSLIDRILIFPDNRIEMVWKVSGFANRAHD
jgi:Recombinase.